MNQVCLNKNIKQISKKNYLWDVIKIDLILLGEFKSI